MSFLGQNLKELEEEWREEGIEPKFGSVKNELMVTEWIEYFNQSDHFMEEEIYDHMKELVHSHTLSGTFYAPAKDIDQTGRLSQWYKSEEVAQKKALYATPVLELTIQEVPGIDSQGDEGEVILGECFLKPIQKEGQIIKVELC
jgi:hypothetical protein